MAAVYQLTHDEMKTSINTWRNRREYVRGRHELLLARLIGSELDPKLQQMLLHSKDAFSTCIMMLAQPSIERADKDLIKLAFQNSPIVE